MKIYVALLRRLSSAWQRHTPRKFLFLVCKNIGHYGTEVLSGGWRHRSKGLASPFDNRYGVETEDIREVGSLDIAFTENARHACRYQPSPRIEATELIRSLDIDPASFQFLDFGAGKGRILLIAAQFPFQAVIGIEFSKELCKIAEHNVTRTATEMCAAARIECVCADASKYDPPDTPLVCYFYNPFDEVIMGAVAKNLEDSLRRNPREMYLIYMQPIHRACFDRSGLWTVITESNVAVVYRSRS